MIKLAEADIMYSSPHSVDAAIKQAARNASTIDPSIPVNKRISIEYLNRFLCRVFADSKNRSWVLKGGMALLARLPYSRATRDIDLACSTSDIEESINQLKQLAHVDLGDFFHFEFVEAQKKLGTELQPYKDAYTLSFDVYLGQSQKGRIKIDLVAARETVGSVLERKPIQALSLPKLISYPYRIYPIEDHLADKVCAILEAHGERESSREKDLVDLVIIACSEDIDGAVVAMALNLEMKRRGIKNRSELNVPSSWGIGYQKLAKDYSSMREYSTIESGLALAHSYVDPILQGETSGLRWSHTDLRWIRKKSR